MKNSIDNEEDLLIAKVLDKKRQANRKNIITYTDFLNQREQNLISKNADLANSFFFGGNENSDRKILVFYPDKLNEELARKALNEILVVLRIQLPNEMKGKYEHRNYLSAFIKIGIDRGKIGDILLDENGADILIFDTNKKFLKQSLAELTRFKKSEIEIVPIDKIRKKIDRFEEFTIIVSSMRIDNIVSELARCSRNFAMEYVKNEMVLVNYEFIKKTSKIVNINDIITIRRVGKFIIDGLVRNTKNDRIVLKVRKYA